ncbi:xanthine dehydrogenase C subunit [Paenibacillus sp. SORGH_AS306]|uniref:FAD binding domain-containing protein n=1 Tax=unclassified Paenibacillus TaxID=185978 RepID=UPI0027888089|nr:MULTISPECIES: FAD binding domain-containing protein [unclassified Paenibacillus]MDQ1233590.1 xanthine dehydrogenase C subunit [Paenibacillus sp. SORGH_AS_0306]MDR6110632.1 xanthine dehydrogenase C subunit [Paenibacillus sp. SORGH_AS_0338]
MEMNIETSRIPDPFSRKVWEPADAEEAMMIKRQYGADAVFVAGGTLLRTQWEGGIVNRPEHFIRLDTIADLCGIHESDQHIYIGALTRLRECGADAYIAHHGAALYESCRHIAAPSIRNQATIGGNIASAVGDAIPALLVHNASLHWADIGSEVTTIEQDLSDWLEIVKSGRKSINAVLLGINLEKQNRLLATESIEQSVDHQQEITFFRKIGRREAFTPSLVTVAFRAKIDPLGYFSQVRIAAGGGSGIAMRLSTCEQLLEGNRYQADMITSLARLASDEFITYSDPFASEQYRQQTAGNLLAAGLWETIHAQIERR